jgi:cation channel sperm-associated protein 2
MQQKHAKKVVEADMRSLRFGTRMAKYPPLDIYAHWLLNTTSFSALMVGVIVINSILIAVDLELEDDTKSKEMRRVLENLDFFFLMLFAAEIILKWIDDFRKFWQEGWNFFDFFVTLLVQNC